MKAPKYIQKIAAAKVAKDAKEYDFIANNKEEWQASNERELLKVKKAILSGRLYLGVESVSRSGMSRIITIKYIEDNTLKGVSDMVYTLAGCDSSRRISGCGMDMLFHAQYNLFRALCPSLDYTKKLPRYNCL